jgi:hypothetical protein
LTIQPPTVATSQWNGNDSNNHCFRYWVTSGGDFWLKVIRSLLVTPVTTTSNWRWWWFFSYSYKITVINILLISTQDRDNCTLFVKAVMNVWVL